MEWRAKALQWHGRLARPGHLPASPPALGRRGTSSPHRPGCLPVPVGGTSLHVGLDAHRAHLLSGRGWGPRPARDHLRGPGPWRLRSGSARPAPGPAWTCVLMRLDLRATPEHSQRLRPPSPALTCVLTRIRLTSFRCRGPRPTRERPQRLGPRGLRSGSFSELNAWMARLDVRLHFHGSHLL